MCADDIQSHIDAALLAIDAVVAHRDAIERHEAIETIGARIGFELECSAPEADIARVVRRATRTPNA